MDFSKMRPTSQTEARDKRNRKIGKKCSYSYDEISKLKGSRKANRLAMKVTFVLLVQRSLSCVLTISH